MRPLSSMRALFVSLVSFSVVACGGGDSTNPFENGVENFTAKIDGVAWNAEFEPVASNPQAGLYVISGVRTTGTVYTIVITLHNITGTGTFPLGVNLQVFGGQVVLSDATSGWATTLDRAAGEIVITTLTATRIAGTFEFVADPLTSGSTRTVTEGQFDVAITGMGGVAAANRGSSITGTVGGAFAAAQVTHSLTPGGTPTLTIVANNTDRGLTISISNATGADTYILAPTRTIFANADPGNFTAIWRSDLTGGSGTVIISSMTADRIEGTFTAELVPGSAGASGNRSISGSFSLGRGGP